MELKLGSMSSRFSFKWRWDFGSFTSFACQGAQANGTREEFFGDTAAVVGFTCALMFCVIVAQCVTGGTVFISPLKQERNSKCPLCPYPSLLCRGGTELELSLTDLITEP